ncbi:MAG: response regulator [Bacteroidetes bacterium]|nr:response regulator [Bacteroidota bacterium]
MILLSGFQFSWLPWTVGAAVLVLVLAAVRLHIRSLVYGQRQLREGIRKKTQELRRETERAIRSEKIKEEFLANMSHEIRTPMNAVVGLVNLLLHQDPRPDQLKYLKTLRQSANHLLAVIDDILDLSKIEAGKLPILRDVFDLDEMLEALRTMLDYRATGKGLQLLVEKSPGTPRYVIGDVTRINQILVNLGSNAVKFTESGSVTIRVAPMELPDQSLVGTGLHGTTEPGFSGWLRFSVTDTGNGISPERLPHMFESFTQESNTITKRYGGTGLGLAISRRLADLLKGKLYATSEPGKGSTFTLDIPLPQAEAPQHNSAAVQEQINFAPNLQILLAEDDSFNQMVAIDTLEAHIPGIKINVASNGKEAVEMYRKQAPDLILMDIQMPVMDGLEASQLIRKEEDLNGGKRIPILAITANVLPSDVERCLAAGMNGLVPKPFQVEDLLRQMSKALAHP